MKISMQLFSVSVLVLLCLTVHYDVIADVMNGRVVAVRGDSITIRIDPGQRPVIGDRIEISFGTGEDKVLVGTWQVTSVQGQSVTADVIDKFGEATLDMDATIFSETSSLGQGELIKQQDRYGQREEIEDLPWLKDDSRAGSDSTSQIENIPEPVAVKQSSAVENVSQPGAALLYSFSNNYEMIWKDSGSGANEDFASFRARAEQGYFPLGDVAVASPWPGERYTPPRFMTMLVKSGTMETKKPVSFKLTWSSAGSHSDAPFSSWEPVPPPGYVCLGDVGSRSLNEMPPLDAIRCLPMQCVRQTGLENKIWDDRGSGARIDFSAWLVPDVNLYIGTPSHARPRGEVYTINPGCFN